MKADRKAAKEKKRRRAASADPKKDKKRRRSGSEESPRSGSPDPVSDEELFQSAKPGKSGDHKLGMDRGPFGGGPPLYYKKRDLESESDSDSIFREAPTRSTTQSGQQKLSRYSQKFPGRLASRLLIKMREASARDLVGAHNEDSSTPPLASHFLLTVLIPALGQKASLRTQRELRTLIGLVSQGGDRSVRRPAGTAHQSAGSGLARRPLEQRSVPRTRGMRRCTLATSSSWTAKRRPATSPPSLQDPRKATGRPIAPRKGREEGRIPGQSLTWRSPEKRARSESPAK